MKEVMDLDPERAAVWKLWVLTAISRSPTVREPSLAAGLPWTMAVTKTPFSRLIPLSEGKKEKYLNSLNTTMEADGFTSRLMRALLYLCVP